MKRKRVPTGFRHQSCLVAPCPACRITSAALPEMLVVTFRDSNPFFDTSYSVNTANHWGENFDIARMLKNNWSTLGPKLRGSYRVTTSCGAAPHRYHKLPAVHPKERFRVHQSC